MIAIPQNKLFEHKVTCAMCQKTKTLKLDKEAFLSWRRGAPIQLAMHDVSDGDREMLISGVCEPCFDSMFEGD